MADPAKAVRENVDGDFFVDTTCIDCDTCRQLAPDVFGDTGDSSFVKTQPQDYVAIRRATQALLACPTGSIGTRGPNIARAVMQDFPVALSDETYPHTVYYNGFHSPKSFGAASYVVRHAQGNWLVDSPKFLPHLVKRFEAMGGLKWIFLTHRDDVADAADYARHFGATRIIHIHDKSAQPDAELIIEGEAAIEPEAGFKIIPVPGHTRGHCVLLAHHHFLFTGDHLAWNRDEQQLVAFRRACWYSWPALVNSMHKLAGERFCWVLPGHGDRIYLDAPEMQKKIQLLLTGLNAG